eukprot:47407-Eustigmatos_ZCMA.PRE.1
MFYNPDDVRWFKVSHSGAIINLSRNGLAAPSDAPAVPVVSTACGAVNQIGSDGAHPRAGGDARSDEGPVQQGHQSE